MSQEKFEKLFNEFPAVTSQQWKDKIIQDLKGADYDKKLIWKTIEGFDVKPFYTSEDIDNLPFIGTNPGEYPFVRGNKTNNNDWDVRQDIDLDNPVDANKAAVEAISRGANAIGFRVKDVTTAVQMADLLKDINPETTKIHFTSSRSYPATLDLFIKELGNKGVDKSKVEGSINFDPFTYALTHGEMYTTAENNAVEMAHVLKTIKNNIPNFKALCINGNFLQNAGASIVQELGFSLAAANEYVYQLIGKGLSIDEITPMLQFSMGISSNYFFEIAKLRAARLLWSKIVEQYNPASKESMKMYIHSSTNTWNKTVYDPNVNMLRTTTEAMSAALGGCDSMNVLPYDSTYKTSDTFSRRIARNTQFVLKEESYFNKIVDPAAGSYYIESLTNSIAEQAWKIFNEVEERHGYIAAIQENFVQNTVEETARKRDMAIANRRDVLLGTNQYPNQLEHMLDKIEDRKSCNCKAKAFKNLKAYRGAQAFEELRLTTEKSVKEGKACPKVFLLTIGNLAMRKARATFASNFYACAGFEVIDNSGFKTPEEGVEAAIKANSNVVVICSSDEEYAEIAAPIAKLLKEKASNTNVIVAGNPVELIEQLKSAGVDDFISVKTNVLESLKALQTKLI
ncbi:MAG: methylmalonyl-CoA mutase family protein [Bacteroidota bacterium]